MVVFSLEIAPSISLKETFAAVSKALTDNETIIVQELNDVQGKPVDINGYYEPSDDLTNKIMRPSQTFNRILNSVK